MAKAQRRSPIQRGLVVLDVIPFGFSALVSAAIFGANRQEDQRGNPLRFEDSSRWSVSLWKFRKITFQYKVIRFASRLILPSPANSGSDEPRPTGWCFSGRSSIGRAPRFLTEPDMGRRRLRPEHPQRTSAFEKPSGRC